MVVYMIKSKNIILLSLITLILLTSGCISEKMIDKSPVLLINVSVTGDYYNPIIDANNTTRYVEMRRAIDQPKYPIIDNLPGVFCSLYYNMTRTTYDTSVPYHGPGNYLFTVVFVDGAPMPKSTNDFFNVQIEFIDKDGRGIKKHQLGMRWPVNQSDLYAE